MTTNPLSIEVDCLTVSEKLRADEHFVLLDCREPDEHSIAHIAGAKLLPMGELPARLAELDAYRDRNLVIHCHHGGRSLRVAHWLREQGFSRAQSMAGGIDQWAQEIDPSLARY